MRLPAFIPATCLLMLLASLTGCFPGSTGPADEEKEPHFMNGKLRIRARDYPAAIEEFEKSLEANPRSASAHFELGWLYEEGVKDFATAIYHYQRHNKLRPESPLADRARERIRACKMDLARTEVLGPVTQGLQKNLEQLTAENSALRQTNEILKVHLAARAAAPSPVPPSPAVNSGEPLPTRPGVTVVRPESIAGSARGIPAPTTAAPARPRTHTVKSGETMSSIARRYAVKPERLQAANPKVSPRTLKVGQVLSIPAS
ncbi:MAG: LysM peptidoglycan-binding domain-containing protein [Opitutaceae bacterium]|nr:LysM peptidoglycan-binding domain-containing protein [Verrucomicrobiales bacterium]